MLYWLIEQVLASTHLNHVLRQHSNKHYLIGMKVDKNKYAVQSNTYNPLAPVFAAVY